MQLKHHILAVLAVAMVVAVAVIIPRALDATRTQAADPLFALAIDCDPTTVAVDAACTVPDAVTAFGVSVILSNNSGAPVMVAAFNYTRSHRPTSDHPRSTAVLHPTQAQLQSGLQRRPRRQRLVVRSRAA